MQPESKRKILVAESALAAVLADAAVGLWEADQRTLEAALAALRGLAR